MGAARQSASVIGALLILFGLLLLINTFWELEWQHVRSYGLLILGGGFLWRNLVQKPKASPYWPSVALLTGLYFLGAQWDLYPLSRGLTISALTLIFGIGFYVKFLLYRSNWEYLVWGNLILLFGFLFLFDHLGIIPGYVLVQFVDVYWPILLILAGLVLIVGSFFQRKQQKQTSDKELSSLDARESFPDSP